MGCFLGCLRFKSRDRRKTHLVSERPDPKSRDPRVPKNQLASTFLYEEEAFLCEQGLDIRSPEKIDEYCINRDLRDETPPEIQRSLEEISIQTVNEDILPSNLHSQLRLDTSCKKLKRDEQCDEILHSPAQLHEGSTSPASKSQSYKSKEYEKSGKFVRFEEVKNVYLDEPGKHLTALDISPSQNDSQQQPDTSNSPYPTPLNLTDEMQTPGTVYPATADDLRTGKKARIRTQYVYPVLKPVENLSQWKALKEDSNNVSKSSDLLQQDLGIPGLDCRENVEQTPMLRHSNLSLRVSSLNAKRTQNDGTIYGEKYASVKSLGSVVQPLNGREHSPELLISSLSQWLKPAHERENSKNVRREQSPSAKCYDRDRPILGAVAAHWNYDELSTVPPKSWDGNGIPNTTTKYKEDQKVSWHATPFEVRLEKALSDEKLLPQRKLCDGRPIEFDEEGAESETTAY